MSASSIIRAAAIQSLLKPFPHPLDASRVRMSASLGDQVGMTKLGIHKTTLAPNMVSTVEHFHDIDDEWFYILDGNGTLLCAGEGEDTTVSAGDFVGFAAGERRPHAFRAGEGGMEYLVGGSREPADVCHYPLIEKTLVVTRTPEKKMTLVDTKDAQTLVRKS
ncbi:Cupin-2 domain-containing protein [Mycena sanguinolenta]|uniref:Cupin-2 domain-containing protein n=1 Tax=Mycena sanguinolenta TaxID=230812 RepID=A0A8H7DKP9_9AGAR|nr:Cupin-2 domain-containing protein [Mycena sanguinolenta]